MSEYQARIHLLDSLYDRYSASFWGEIRKSLFSTPLCEEVLLNSFKEIWKSLPETQTGEMTFCCCFRIVRKEIEKKKVELLLKEIFACQQPAAELTV